MMEEGARARSGQHDVEPFRARYRAAISPFYHAGLHAGFVFVTGFLVIAFLLAQVSSPPLWAWLAVPLALLVFSWGEYTVHRELGHRKRPWAALFYKRHTGDHHSFFVTERMSYETARDWRVILFPAWLIVVYTLFLVAPAFFLLSRWDMNVAALFSATLVAGYLLYEAMHACQHLPASHWLATLPWIRQMRRHHALHHRRDLMQTHNFNLVFPLMDWLKGTGYRE